jgi:DNA-binding MarR family transcriptional regulator
VAQRPTAFEPTIAGVARVAEVALAEQRLTIQKYRVLSHLARAPLSPSQLADRLSVKAPVISRMVETLMQLRYIERRRDELDGRRSVLALSSSGRAVLTRANAAIRRRIEEVLDELDESEREVALRGLRLWSIAMGRHVERVRDA